DWSVTGVQTCALPIYGPSEAMLCSNYKALLWLNADVGEGSLGPYVDQTDDDIGLLTAFLNVVSVGYTSLPRHLAMFGRDLVKGRSEERRVGKKGGVGW